MRHSRLAIVIPSLAGGGAERVTVDLANHWSRRGREIALIEIGRAEPPRYALDSAVRRIGLNLLTVSPNVWSAMRANLRRIRALRAAISDSGATAVVSFTDTANILTLLASRGLGRRVIICERTDPRHHALPRIWNWLRNRTYRRAAVLVVQTDAVRQWAESRPWRCPIAVIGNAAPEWGNRPIVARSADDRLRRVMALGRLSPEKGHRKLIEAFARVAAQFPGWQLEIHGEGSERAALEQLVQQLGIGKRVRLPGWVDEVPAVLETADLFVLPSRYEGFPNALLEAMACGVACISFDCDSGPRAIIRDRIDGLLVPPGDVPALANAMESLMANAAYRSRLAEEARSVVVRFARDATFRHWDIVLDGD